MKKLVLLPALAVLTLGACQMTDTNMADETMAADAMPALAVTQFIGKTLTSDSGVVFLFQDGGTIGGTFRGEDVVGTYTSTATEICSTYSAPANLTGREYCSTPAVSGDTVIFNRRDGSQSPPYTISG